MQGIEKERRKREFGRGSGNGLYGVEGRRVAATAIFGSMGILFGVNLSQLGVYIGGRGLIGAWGFLTIGLNFILSFKLRAQRRKQL